MDVATLSDDVLDDVAADAYGLLNGVLESLDDHYVHRQPGLQRTIEEVDGLLRRVDADLHKHLDEVGVLLLQVTFRWINCLLVRERAMRCAIRLWDTCLAEERGFRTFFPAACAAFLCRSTRSRRSPPRTCTSSSRRCRRRTGPTTRSDAPVRGLHPLDALPVRAGAPPARQRRHPAAAPASPRPAIRVAAAAVTKQPVSALYAGRRSSARASDAPGRRVPEETPHRAFSVTNPRMAARATATEKPRATTTRRGGAQQQQEAGRRATAPAPSITSARRRGGRRR